MNNIKTNNQRDFLFDNLKAILLILVIFGHAIEFVIYNSNGIVKYIYILHCTFFICLCLYLSADTFPKNIIQKN